MPRPNSLTASSADEWLVYADELLGRGDRRGELIIAQAQAGSRDRERALFVELSQALGLELLGGASAEWRFGHLLRLHAPAIGLFERLLRHPSAQLLESLVLDNPNVDMSEQCVLVAARAPRSLRSVRVQTRNDATRYLERIPLGRLLGIPSLEELVVDAASVQLGRGGDVPRLQRLEWASDDVDALGLEPWTFATLHELSLHAPRQAAYLARGSNWSGAIRVEPYPLQAEHWTPLRLGPRLVAGIAAPALERLTFTGFAVGPEALDGLLKLLDRGVKVDVSDCAVDPGVRRSLDAASARR